MKVGKSMIWLTILTLGALASITGEEYKEKDFSYLIGMKGFSDKMLKMHFSLYAGYVKNTNLILNDLQKSDGYVFGALKRRLGWEMDGMLLHEYYFENLGGKTPIDPDSGLYKQLKQDFGSYDSWEKDFKATALIRGIGWVVLYQDRQNGTLYNMWINEHDLGHLTNAQPVLVMDVWEHAYMPDYGIDRSAYVNAFFDNINWGVVQNRYNGGLSWKK